MDKSMLIFGILVFVAYVISQPLTGHTKTLLTAITSEELRCVEWDTLCDVAKQELVCCREEIVNVTRLHQSTTCKEGWSEDGSGNCSDSTCEYCSTSSLCLSNGTCAYYCEVVRSPSSSCVCSPGFDKPPRCTDFDNDLISISVVGILERVNIADNQTRSRLDIYKQSSWLNKNGFNYLSMRTKLNLPITLTELNISVSLTSQPGTFTFLKRNGTVADDSIIAERMFCQVNKTTFSSTCSSWFDRYLDHGDSLIMKAEPQIRINKPFRIYRNIPLHGRIVMKFDFKSPSHCVENNCGLQPMKIYPEISNGTIHIEWKGWSDDLSGIKHFILRVYKLTPDKDGNLIQPPESQFSTTKSLNSTDHVYTPNSAGVYAFVLMVEDMASNKAYVRRFAIYDPSSKIDIQNRNRLYFSTATSVSDYHWQSNNTFINVTWTGHFVNTVQNNGHFLSKIAANYVHIDNVTIKPRYDDHEGELQLTPMSSFGAIVKYEYIRPLSSAPSDDIPSGITWLSQNISQEFIQKTFTKGVDDGRSYKVWVKAYDIMGHTAIDSTYVFFDSSPPKASRLRLTINIPTKNSTNYASSVAMQASDRSSGIYQIQWQVLHTQTGRILSTGFTPGNKTSNKQACESDINGCICAADNICYLFEHHLYIDHCTISLTNEELQSANLSIKISVINKALLSHNSSLQLGKATQLAGIHRYSPPINIRTSLLSTDSATIVWDFEQNCYTRTGIRVFFGKKSQKPQSSHILQWNSTQMDVIGLLPDTEYTASFVVHYGVESSFNHQYSFTTDSEKVDKKYIGVIACLSVAMLGTIAGLIFLLIKLKRARKYDQDILSMNLMKRTTSDESHLASDGTSRYKKTPTLKMSEKKESDVKNGINGHKPNMHTDLVTEESDTELYEDLEPPGIYTPSSNYDSDNSHAQTPVSDFDITNITLHDMLSEGSFTSIYIGTCDMSTVGTETCAFKTTSMDLSEEEIIGFEEHANKVLEYSKKYIVGKAPNIMSYYNVVDLGCDLPKLVMEYCGNGVLSEWLSRTSQQTTINDLQNIVHGIAQGMQYLTVRKLYHGNLTSFNVLLTDDLVPKIRGFGPGNFTKRSNVKWLAPEVLAKPDVKASEASDSWSYGVVTWEIFSKGALPYEDIQEEEILANLNKGYALKKPTQCPKPLYGVIKMCLLMNKKERPTFAYIIEATDPSFLANNAKDSVQVADDKNDEEPGLYENTDTNL